MKKCFCYVHENEGLEYISVTECDCDDNSNMYLLCYISFMFYVFLVVEVEGTRDEINKEGTHFDGFSEWSKGSPKSPSKVPKKSLLYGCIHLLNTGKYCDNTPE